MRRVQLLTTRRCPLASTGGGRPRARRCRVGKSTAVPFTLVVVQLDGRITDRRVYTSAEVRGDGSGPDFAAGCRSLLAEKVPAVLTDTARFQIPLDPDDRLRLAWVQPTSHAAMAAFAADERPLFTAAFLSGRETRPDLAADLATEANLADLPWARATDSAITLPPDHPLTALTPRPPTVASGDSRRVFLWALGLSVAFFERAGADEPPTHPTG